MVERQSENKVETVMSKAFRTLKQKQSHVGGFGTERPTGRVVGGLGGG